jgi:hypothetical protein
MKKLLVLSFLVTSLQLNAAEWLIGRMQKETLKSAAELQCTSSNTSSKKVATSDSTNATICKTAGVCCALGSATYCCGPKACCCATALAVCGYAVNAHRLVVSAQPKATE